MARVANRFLDLVAKSVITQAFITSCLMVTCCWLWVNQRPVPSDLLGITLLVVGFWFGSKLENARLAAIPPKEL